MSLYQPEHTLYGDYVYRDWEPKLVEEVLGQLNPSNMRVDVVTQHFDSKAPGRPPRPRLKD
jgi:nardilysin